MTGAKEYAVGLWWLFVTQGVLAATFGLVTLFLPKLTLATLLTVFALYLLAAGAITIINAFTQTNRSWLLTALTGTLLVGAGAFLLVNPSVVIGVFAALLGIFIIARGILDLGIAFVAAQRQSNRWLWAFSGVLGVIAGLVIWKYPIGSSVAFSWVLGLYALLAGLLAIIYALRIRTLYKQLITKSNHS